MHSVAQLLPRGPTTMTSGKAALHVSWVLRWLTTPSWLPVLRESSLLCIGSLAQKCTRSAPCVSTSVVASGFQWL